MHELFPPLRVEYERVNVGDRVGDAPLPRPDCRPPPCPVVHSRGAQRGQHARRQHRFSHGREADGYKEERINEDDFGCTEMQENMWARLRESHIITTLVLSKTVSEQDLVS